MSKNDYNKQALRRQRIKQTTFIVGVDIGNAFNALGFMDKEGNVLGSCTKLYNSREGFEQFVDMIEGLKGVSEHLCNKFHGKIIAEHKNWFGAGNTRILYKIG